MGNELEQWKLEQRINRAKAYLSGVGTVGNARGIVSDVCPRTQVVEPLTEAEKDALDTGLM